MTSEDINWAPLNVGGSNFKTRILNTKDPNKWVFELSGIMCMLPWFFIGIGSFTGVVFIISIIMIPAAFVSLTFVIIGVIWRKRLKKVIMFDFGSGFFWKGKANLSPPNR